MRMRLTERVNLDVEKSRKKQSRNKFFNGMYAEYSGLVIHENGYIDSITFINFLNRIIEHLDTEPAIEHLLYTVGKNFLASRLNDNAHIHTIQKSYGSNWKVLRFQNLVRLGADINNAGLDSLPRPTLVGAFLYQKEGLRQGKNILSI